jgi:hypothetical protein
VADAVDAGDGPDLGIVDAHLACDCGTYRRPRRAFVKRETLRTSKESSNHAGGDASRKQRCLTAPAPGGHIEEL